MICITDQTQPGLRPEPKKLARRRQRFPFQSLLSPFAPVKHFFNFRALGPSNLQYDRGLHEVVIWLIRGFLRHSMSASAERPGWLTVFSAAMSIFGFIGFSQNLS